MILLNNNFTVVQVLHNSRKKKSFVNTKTQWEVLKKPPNDYYPFSPSTFNHIKFGSYTYTIFSFKIRLTIRNHRRNPKVGLVGSLCPVTESVPRTFSFRCSRKYGPRPDVNQRETSVLPDFTKHQHLVKITFTVEMF